MMQTPLLWFVSSKRYVVIRFPGQERMAPQVPEDWPVGLGNCQMRWFIHELILAQAQWSRFVYKTMHLMLLRTYCPSGHLCSELTPVWPRDWEMYGCTPARLNWRSRYKCSSQCKWCAQANCLQLGPAISSCPKEVCWTVLSKIINCLFWPWSLILISRTNPCIQTIRSLQLINNIEMSQQELVITHVLPCWLWQTGYEVI